MKNEHLIKVSGKLGKGMDASALFLASKIDSNFSTDDVVFTLKEYLKLCKIKDGES